MRAIPDPVTLLYRLVAAWLITLIVLPFTAPFKTFDLGAATIEAAVDGSIAKPVPLPVTAEAVSAPLLTVRFDVVRTFASGSDYYRIRHTVLRI